MKDDKRIRSLDDHIAEAIRAVEKSGEMAKARDYGKPIDFGDGYDETPPELRMAFKVLKDAGYAPPEVAMLRELGVMRKSLEAIDPRSPEAAALRQRIVEHELKVRLRIEALGKR